MLERPGVRPRPNRRSRQCQRTPLPQRHSNRRTPQLTFRICSTSSSPNWQNESLSGSPTQASVGHDSLDEWLDSRHAAEYLGVHRDTLRKLAASGPSHPQQDGPGCKLYFRRVISTTGAAAAVGHELAARCVRAVYERRPERLPPRRVERNIYRRPLASSRSASRTRRASSDGGPSTAGSRLPGLSATSWSLSAAGVSVSPTTLDSALGMPPTSGWAGRSLTFARQPGLLPQRRRQPPPRLGSVLVGSTRSLQTTSRTSSANLRADGLAEASIAIVVGVTNRVYRYAARRLGWVGTNPVSLMLPSERPKPSQAQRRRLFEGTELEETIAAATEPYQTLFTVAALTGARLSSCSA